MTQKRKARLTVQETTKTKRKYTSPYERQEESVRLVLKERDLDIVKLVNTYKYLQTSHVHQLLFDKASKRRAQTRLMKLFQNGYLGRVTPIVAPGKGSSETAYYLDQAGKELLEMQGIEALFYAKAGKISHHNLLHSLDLSDFRVNLELALREPKLSEIIELKSFVADFEIKGRTDKAVHPHRFKLYKLYDEIIHPTTKEPLIIYPDASIILKGKGKYEKHEELYFLEVDRGTEGLQVIQKKVIAYHYYKQQGIFKKFGENLKTFTVLIQTSSTKRAENMRKALADVNGSDLIWVSDISKVNQQSIMQQAIWQDHKGTMQAVIKL